MMLLIKVSWILCLLRMHYYTPHLLPSLLENSHFLDLNYGYGIGAKSLIDNCLEPSATNQKLVPGRTRYIQNIQHGTLLPYCLDAESKLLRTD
jgi:hypothetical protein